MRKTGWGWTLSAVVVGIVLGIALAHGLPGRTTEPVASRVFCNGGRALSIDSRGDEIVPKVVCQTGSDAGTDVTALTTGTVLTASVLITGLIVATVLRLSLPSTRPRRRPRSAIPS